LANLSRLDMSENELVSMQKEIGSILQYVDQIQTLNVENKDIDIPISKNVMRNDDQPKLGGQHTDDLVKLAPYSEGKAIKVKNIF
jgi:aspartyl/glutamyl-tRNA(Asn/Gln) amidotransferase C subunit